MGEPHYFVEAYETKRGKRFRRWRRHLRNLAVAFAIACFAVALLAGTVSAYAALASPFPLI
jgi:hypothetical protein